MLLTTDCGIKAAIREANVLFKGRITAVRKARVALTTIHVAKEPRKRDAVVEC